METFTRGGLLDALWVVWWLRCTAMLLVVSPIVYFFVQGYYRYRLRFFELDNELEKIIAHKEEKLARIGAFGEGGGKEKTRLIPVYTNSPGISYSNDEEAEEVEYVYTNKGEAIPQRDAVYFVKRALDDNDDGPGLGIGRWKSVEKWHQSRVEAILDYLHYLGFVTERRNGRACEWTDDYRVGEVLEAIFDDQYQGTTRTIPRPIA